MRHHHPTAATIILIPILAFVSMADAQLSFVEGGQQLNNLTGYAVALVDLNADGRLDAFVVNYTPVWTADVRVYFNDGSGGFIDSGQRLAAGSPGIYVSCGDINGDGRIEVINARTVWFNDGAGHFTADTNRFADSDGTDFLSAKFADINGDGRLDVFAIVFDAPSRIYTNDGAGFFRDTGRRIGGGIQANVILADVNRDGSVDALTTGWRDDTLPGGTNDYCPNRVWTNNGAGILIGTGQVIDESTRHIHASVLGDLNNDGVPDLVIGMGESPWARIYTNNGAGWFSLRQNVGNRRIDGLAVADFNGDGYLDAYFGCGNPPSSDQVMLNNGAAQFVNSGLSLASGYTVAVAAGDLDGDGDADVIAVHGADASGAASPARVFYNNRIPPRLNGRRGENGMALWWAANATGFTLESASVPPGPWTGVTGVTTNSMTVPMGSDSQFFRLRK